MTLEEAIKHTKDIVKDVSECTDCRMEHKQLTGWLEELLAYRKMDKHGRLLRLPFSLESECIYVVEKYGMKIYKLDAEKIEISKMPISNDILYEIDGFELTFLDFGEIAFLTRGEAESKLKEMEESHEWG